MLRKQQASDWAADDDDNDIGAIVQIQQSAAPLAAPATTRSSSNSNSSANVRGNNNNSRQEKNMSSSSESEPPRNRWGRTPDEVQAGGRRAAAAAGSDIRMEYNRSGSSGRDNYSSREGGGRDNYERRDGSGSRDNYSNRDYERRDNYSSRDSGSSRDYDRRDSSTSYSRNDDRYSNSSRESRRPQHVESPLEQGVVVAIKESFGFVSCMDRDGDLFFHITEAPLDVCVQDEVEFRVQFNKRSGKEVASQLVVLPRGTITFEDVSETVVAGLVTRGVRSAGPSSDARQQQQRQQRDDAHGTIELVERKAAAATDSPADSSTTEEPPTDASSSSDANVTKQLTKRNVVRFTLDSVASSSNDKQSTAAPAYGDEVQFRIATHRKTGVKRAVDVVVTASAKAKLEQEIAAKLATLTRERGVVDKLKAGGGGFIKCADRLDDVYFPLHEVRAATVEDKEDDDKDNADVATMTTTTPVLREGDNVSFFVLEERDREDATPNHHRSGRLNARRTAMRVQLLPQGSVVFETLVRANVAGIVTKTAKVPRNQPEVTGAITPTVAAADATDAMDAVTTTSPVAGSKSKKSKSAGASNAAAAAMPFRLGDTHDATYVPGIGDAVTFDEVVETRSGKSKAVNVQLVALNAQHRERGVIASLRDDFGFIKCADRAMDAYFRFSDVMTTSKATGLSIRIGTDVAFDVSVDPTKGDNARATRIELLPHGSVQWETVIATSIAGDVVALPANATSSSSRSNSRGGGGASSKSNSLKVAQGRIRFGTSSFKLWLEFLPELKRKIDHKFVDATASSSSSNTEVEDDAVAAAVESTDKIGDKTSDTTNNKTTEKTADKTTDKASGKTSDKSKKKELKLLFPSSLSTAERFAVHQYCDALAITHQSVGDGANRRLELVASAKVPALSAAAYDALPALELEFKAEDVAEVRYSPRVGDRVTFTLAQATRTKQLLCKSIVCVESSSNSSGAATKSVAKKNKDKDVAAATTPARGEGYIVLVRNEGFGFIQPALAAHSSAAGSVPNNMDENLFFHIKEVTTGETLEELVSGMEVQFTPVFDDVKKKTRAINIAVVPAGTIQKPLVQVLRGVVTRPSFLQSFKAKGGRHNKSSKAQALSTIGKIRAVAVDNESEAVEADADKEERGNDTDAAAAASDSAPTESATTQPATPKKKKPTTTTDAQFAYNIKDIVDASVVLREGDEVEFTTVATPKGPRASKIRVLALHAKQGVVVKVHDDLGGLIRVDSSSESDSPALEIPFAARHVLRGDVLHEGDRVEFAHSRVQPPVARKIGTAAAAAAAAAKAETSVNAEAEEKAEKAEATTETENKVVVTEEAADVANEGDKTPTAAVVGHATSVLRLSAAPAGTGADTRTRAPRTVNSSLLQAMRQVGASAVVASRMAKGPDGTRGFKDGWRTELSTDASDATPTAGNGDDAPSASE